MYLVECHSDFVYAEKPVSFLWEGQRHKIIEILAQGRTPEARWFRVVTEDRQVFELAYSEDLDRWQIQAA